VAEPCRVYWGSHGCMHPRGHAPDTPHECDCCECEQHPDPDSDSVCVARPPYYGPGTRFYGEDAAVLGLPLVEADRADPLTHGVLNAVLDDEEQRRGPLPRAQWAPRDCTCPWPWPLNGAHIRDGCPGAGDRSTQEREDGDRG
jgi:hypothetical protein